jgi:hypothetical protein
MNNSEIISSDTAFLGHGSKISSIKHTFNRNVLICQESQRFLLPPTLISFYFGSFIPLAIYFSWIDLAKEPVFAKILLFLAVIGSWILFIAMLLYHKRITIDFSSNTIIFLKKGLKKKQFRIDLSQIDRIVSGSIKRVHSDNTDNVVTCHYFSILRFDHTEIRMCETTCKEELEEIVNIFLEHCRQKLQWSQEKECSEKKLLILHESSQKKGRVET